MGLRELKKRQTRQLIADTAWQLLFNALPASEAAGRVRIDGREALGRAFLHARSVVV